MPLMLDRRIFTQFDWVLLVLLIIIPSISLITLYSAAYDPNSNPVNFFGFELKSFAFIKQSIFFLLGYVAIFLALFISTQSIERLAYLIYGICIVLLIMVFFFGVKSNGSRRWIDLGSFRFQPSELMKIGIIVCISRYCSRKKNINKPYSLKELIIPSLLLLIPFRLILSQPDLGTALSILFIGGGIIVFAGIKPKILFYLVATFLSALVPAWIWVLKAYQKRRILALLNPDADPFGSGYHIIQSKIAVGSGAFFGKGYMQGTQSQLEFLPEHTTDFIFSVLAEEWGFIGAGITILLYYLLISRILVIAKKSRDNFSMYFAVGVSLMLFFHVLVNTGMVLGILPVVGLPLPLLSYGGTAVMSNFLMFGLVLGIGMRRFTFKGVDKLIVICFLIFVVNLSKLSAEELKIENIEENKKTSKEDFKKGQYFNYDFDETYFNDLPEKITSDQFFKHPKGTKETAIIFKNRAWNDWYRDELDIVIGLKKLDLKFEVETKGENTSTILLPEIVFDLSHYLINQKKVKQVSEDKVSKNYNYNFYVGNKSKKYKIKPSKDFQERIFLPFKENLGFVVIAPRANYKEDLSINGFLLCPRIKNDKIRIKTLPVLSNVAVTLKALKGDVYGTVKAKVNTGFGKGLAFTEIQTTRSTSPASISYDISKNLKPYSLVDYIPAKREIPFFKVDNEKAFMGIRTRAGLNNSLNHFTESEVTLGIGVKSVELKEHLPLKINKNQYVIESGKCYSIIRLLKTEHNFQKKKLKDSKSLEELIEAL